MKAASCAALLVFCHIGAVALAAESLDISSVERRLNANDWQQVEVGRLTWHGGLELSARSSDFGGLSALLLSPDGERLTMVSDQGRWFAAQLTYDTDGNLSELEEGQTGPLLGPDGKPLDGKTSQDAEGLARLSDGAVLVSFEHDHRMLLYPTAESGRAADTLAGVPRVFAAPEGLEDLPPNDGIEALVALDRERVLALTGVTGGAGLYRGFLWQDGQWHDLSLVAEGKYKPTGAAWLPGRGIVLLERRFSLLGGLSVRMREIPLDQVAPGAILTGDEIAVLDPPLTIDNFEGVGLHRNGAGALLVTLLSDDNFHFLQRTLLLQFAVK